MFGIAASARAASRRSALEQDPSTIGTSNVVSSMEGLSGNLPSAGSFTSAGSLVANAPQSEYVDTTPKQYDAQGRINPFFKEQAKHHFLTGNAKKRKVVKNIGMRTPSVFNERTQSRAKSIFGDNNQRQASVNGSCEK